MDPVLRLRNDLFREFYYFFCEFYASRFNRTARKVLEGSTLIAVSQAFVFHCFNAPAHYIQAVVMVFLWGYSHFVFVKDPENCIPDIGQLQSDIIIQIEVYHNSTTLWKQRNKAVTRLVILNEIAKCNASNMSTETGEYVCATEDINSLYGRVFLVPVTQCSVSNYSRCNHVNHKIVREVSHHVNQVSKPLYYTMGRSGELTPHCVYK